MGLSKAIEPIRSNERTLTALMARRNPLRFPLWWGAGWFGYSCGVEPAVVRGADHRV